jgi:hypothetical protein
MSQNNMLVNHLMKVGSITGVEASAIYKIRALPRRIKDLREQGYDIVDDWKKDVTGQRYKRYTMR